MSKEAVIQFREAVNKNEGLQEAIRNAGASLDVVAFAREQGYEFTEEELLFAAEEIGDGLTDFELEMVGGGAGGAVSHSNSGEDGGAVLPDATGDTGC